jgi:hypothetical protein
LFKREHHLRVGALLESLNAELLASRHCYFGGGTAIVLIREEYRESVDIDFLVSDVHGYRELRQAITGPLGINSLARPGCKLSATREIRADQYGIRTSIDGGAGVEIKFEIVLEGRISLDRPGANDRVGTIATLSPVDMAATKLLANSDRWMDDGVFSRDLIDLAMLQLPKPSFKKAMQKAESAYGAAIGRDLNLAVVRLSERAGRLDECMSALQISGVPKAVLWSRIRKLKATH